MLENKRGILVQGVNCQGVMGSGIAKEIRAKWPDCYSSYLTHCNEMKTRNSLLGSVNFYDAAPGLLIANCFTQNHYGKDDKKYVSYPAIHRALTTVMTQAIAFDLPVHYPLIGAGLGGGDWAIISDIIDSVFESHVEIERTLWLLD
jgi:O-acetyl-ADP-ribose deacetylase (regulator of RNase III)